MDQFQQRYLNHQGKKKMQILNLIRDRHSDRVFSDRDIDVEDMKKVIESAYLAPSSCDRKAILLKHIKFRDNKQLLSGLLVGGVGWIHRASEIILLVADVGAYKENLYYMPYLDTGFIAENIWLACTELKIGCCFVNPNAREEHKGILRQFFIRPNEILTGVLALGYMEGK